MATVLVPNDYEEPDLTCKECGRLGKGQDANPIYFYSIMEVKE